MSVSSYQEIESYLRIPMSVYFSLTQTVSNGHWNCQRGWKEEYIAGHTVTSHDIVVLLSWKK